MSYENSGMSEKDLLFQVYEKVVRMEERMLAFLEANNKDHQLLCKRLDELNILQNSNKNRIEVLEKEGVKLSIFWKVMLLVGPITVSIFLNYLLSGIGV